MIELYHYIHCPFCVRVRMALGFLKLSYKSIVISYDDEETPVSLTGLKMLPILKNSKGVIQNESLDIIRDLDSSDLLNFNNYIDSSSEIDELLNSLGSPIHNLAMPYWIYTKEFSPKAREYFLKKKEAKRGPFSELMKKKDIFLNELSPLLEQLEIHLSPFYKSNKLTINDILIASHLWGMYIFPEFQFPEKIHQYLQSIKSQCNFEYHSDFWI